MGTHKRLEAPRAIINQARGRSELDRREVGSFLEYLGRAIYTGVYEPGSTLADAKGFRKDVVAQIKELGVPVSRHSGGKFCFRLQLARWRRAKKQMTNLALAMSLVMFRKPIAASPLQALSSAFPNIDWLNRQ